MIDVCLILEGTYPYVSGGVATWVHQLITSMRDINFGIVHIGAYKDPNRKLKYNIPENVTLIQDIFLHDYPLEKMRNRNPSRKDFKVIKNFYDAIPNYDHQIFLDFIKTFKGQSSCFDAQNIFSARPIWRMLEEYYQSISPEFSFVDYFWTWRSTHLPILSILLAPIPEAKVYHTISTGYAGLYGAIAKNFHKGELFLTEHGIYTYERMLEISQADWIYEDRVDNLRAMTEMSFLKRWWITIFSLISKITYNNCSKIFTLYEQNRLRQVLEGADPQKTEIIPNGIDLKRFTLVDKKKNPSPQIGLIGRVVNIKDVKTYILAAKIILAKIPDAKFYIIGPTEEEEDYYNECSLMIENFQLENSIIFTGQVDVKEYYSFLDVVVLTSLSEAQPYVILEANYCGIPVVATDVGSCREMLEGLTDEEKELQSGLITSVSDPQDTAQAITTLLSNQKMYEDFAKAGKIKVKQKYDQDDLLSRYLNVYEQSL